jgi:hypothetical protein
MLMPTSVACGALRTLTHQFVSKSGTGFVILLAGCPLLWKSALQQETSLSTMMTECVALSAAMRKMLPLKRVVQTIAKVVIGKDDV